MNKVKNPILSQHFRITWKDYLQGSLNNRIIKWLEEYFRAEEIEPSVKAIAEIKEEEVFNSWLAIPSTKELLVFIKMLNTK